MPRLRRQSGHLPGIDFVNGLEHLGRLEIIGAVIDDCLLEPLFSLPQLRQVRLLGEYGSQVDGLRRQNPQCEFVVMPLPVETGLTIQVGPLTLRKIEEDFWSIF